MKIKIIYFALLLNFCFLFGHPIKMTTGKITYNTDSKKLELVINFFLDDFSKCMQDVYRVPAEMFLEINEETSAYIVDYIQKKLHIAINNKKLSIEYNTMSFIEDNVLQVKLYINIQKITYIETLEIQNELLLEVFNDQSNIIHVQIDPEAKTSFYRFAKGNSSTIFKISYACK